MGSRRAGREAAMRILYSMEFSAQPAGQAADDYWLEHNVSDQLKMFTMTIVNGVDEGRAGLDAIISAASDNWPVKRMADIDKNILRIATWELKEHPEIPTAVIIDEAVEMAKQYAAPDSSSFINGILGKIQKEIRTGQGENA